MQLHKRSELPKFMILIQPFSLEVWLSLIVSILASLIMLAIYGILHPERHDSIVGLTYTLMAAFLDQSQIGIRKTRSNVIRSVLIQMKKFIQLSQFNH